MIISTAFRKQKFKHFLVLDFEANCLRGEQIDPQEILEFPCLMVDSEDFNVVSTFHQYVKPVGIPGMLDVGSSGEYINIKYSFQKHTGTYAKVGL